MVGEDLRARRGRRTARVALSDARACPAWVLGNAGERGYYAVVYEEALLTRLLAGGAPALAPPERVGILRDVAVLADAGQVSWASALKIVPEFAEQRATHSSSPRPCASPPAWSETWSPTIGAPITSASS